jgi:hypothetical protein
MSAEKVKSQGLNKNRPVSPVLNEGSLVAFLVPNRCGFSGCYTLSLNDWFMAD